MENSTQFVENGKRVRMSVKLRQGQTLRWEDERIGSLVLHRVSGNRLEVLIGGPATVEKKSPIITPDQAGKIIIAPGVAA